MTPSIDRLLNAMIDYDAGDPERIHHFLKVHTFARLIGLEEHLDQRTQLILEAAAVVHDIGIHQAETVYGSDAGKYQEELGPSEAENLLHSLDWPEDVVSRVSWLVGHHHTYWNIGWPDYQILVEADFLVNLYENQSPPETRRHVYQTIFRTEAGKRLCRTLFPAVEAE